MAVVSIRCHECDEVKRKEHMEIRGDGSSVCDDCRKSDKAKEAEEKMTEGDGPGEEETTQEEPEPPEEEPEEEEDETDDGSKFTEQDALSW